MAINTHGRAGGAGGYVFVCSRDTEGECLALGLFGCARAKLHTMRKINGSTRLFLFNYQTYQLHGIFQGLKPGALLDIEHTAWRGRFPAQIRVQMTADGLRTRRLDQTTKNRFGRLEGPITDNECQQLVELLSPRSGLSTPASLSARAQAALGQPAVQSAQAQAQAERCKRERDRQVEQERRQEVLAGGYRRGDKAVTVVQITTFERNFFGKLTTVSRGEIGTVDDDQSFFFDDDQSLVGGQRLAVRFPQVCLACDVRDLATIGQWERIQAVEKEEKRKEQQQEEESAKQIRQLVEKRRRAEEVLAGGFKRGQTVVALLNFSEPRVRVSRGDIATVLGPADEGLCTEPEQHVLAKFENGHRMFVRPDVDVVSESAWKQIEQREKMQEVKKRRRAKEVLAGGFKRGQTVVALFSDASVSRGDIATVLGPADEGLCTEPEQHVLAKFKHGHRMFLRPDVDVVSESAWKQIEQREKMQEAEKRRRAEEVLAGGFKRGQTVVALFSDASVSRGDIATVLGPADEGSCDEPEQHVLAKFKHGHRMFVRPDVDVVSESAWKQIEQREADEKLSARQRRKAEQKASAVELKQLGGYNPGDCVIVAKNFDDLKTISLQAPEVCAGEEAEVVRWEKPPLLAVKLLGLKWAPYAHLTLGRLARSEVLSRAEWRQKNRQEAEERLLNARAGITPLLSKLADNVWWSTATDECCKQLFKEHGLYSKERLSIRNVNKLGRALLNHPPLLSAANFVQLPSTDASKGDLVAFFQTNCSAEFLSKHKLKGKAKAITKKSKLSALLAVREKILKDRSVLRTKKESLLRFEVGDRVKVNNDFAADTNEGWALGTVVRQHYRESDWEQGALAPYQIKLDNPDSRLVVAPIDDDSVVKSVEAVSSSIGDATTPSAPKMQLDQGEIRKRVWEAARMCGYPSMDLIRTALRAVEVPFGASDRNAFSGLVCSELARGFADLSADFINALAALVARYRYADIFKAMVAAWPSLTFSTDTIECKSGNIEPQPALHLAIDSAGTRLGNTDNDDAESTTVTFVKMLCSLPRVDDDLSIILNSRMETPLHVSVKNGLCGVTQALLVSSPMGIDKKNFDGDTALHMACAQNSESLVKLLLNSGANPHALNKKAKKPQAVLAGSASEKKPLRAMLQSAAREYDPRVGTSPVRPTTPQHQRDSPVRDSTPPMMQFENAANLEQEELTGPPKAIAAAEDPAEEIATVDAVALTGTKRIEHMRQLIRKLEMSTTTPTAENAEAAVLDGGTDWVDEMEDAIVPMSAAEAAIGPSSDSLNDTTQQSAPNHELTAEAVLESDDLSLEGLLFEFEITREASNQLSRLDKPLMQAAMRRLHQVGSGIYSERLWHPLTAGIPKARPGEPRLELYSTGFFKGWRVLWELTPEYSSTKRAWTDMIRVWYVGKHKKYEQKAIDEVIRCFREGKTCIPEMRKRLKRQGNIKMKTGNVREPSLYTLVSADSVDAVQPELESEPQRDDDMDAGHKQGQQLERSHCPPATVVDDSRTLVKFYQMNEAFCTLVLKGILSEKLQLPFKTDQLEDDIINQSGEAALLLVGRSGTGKTTIAMNRMWIAWQRFYASVASGKPSASPASSSVASGWNCVFVTANAVLLHAVRDVFRNMQLSYKGTKVRILPERAAVPMSLRPDAVSEHMFPMFISSEDWLLLLDATVCVDNLDELEASCTASQEAYDFAVSEQHRLNEALAAARSCHSPSKDLKDAESKAKRALQQVNSCHATLKQDQQRLAKAAKPFVEHKADERSRLRSGVLTNREGSLTKLLRQSEIEADDDSPSGRQKAHRDRVRVDAIVFERQFWPACTGDKAGYAASTVWTEIQSYITGSLQSLHANRGHLSHEEYCNLGKKVGLFGNELRSKGTSRRGVYTVFKEYESWKRRQNYYDRMDVVHDVYRRIKAMGYHGVPIHSMSVDEVQDFTQAELCLYLEVVQNPNDLFLAGDTCQTIARGVGFRFEDLTTMFHEMSLINPEIRVPTVTPLSVNYRTHNGILAAAGEIVGMIQEMFPGSIDKLPKDQGYFPGSPPFIVTAREDLLQLLIGSDEEKSQIEFGAHQVIIVRTQEAKKTLPNELKGAIVLTVFEAKGLEFDDVFIIDFFRDSPASEDEWRSICWYMQQWRKHHPGDGEDGEAFATHFLGTAPRPLRDGAFEHNRASYGRVNEELKQLYTAFTRARVSLFMYDSDERKRLPIFHALLTRRLVKKLSMASVNEELAGENLDLDKNERAQVARMRAKSTTPAEWKKSGQKFEERGLYDAAIKCFENSGDRQLLHRARGLHILSCLLPEAKEKGSEDEVKELAVQAGYEFLQTGDRDLLEYSVDTMFRAELYAEAADLAQKLGGDTVRKVAQKMERLGALQPKKDEQQQRVSRAAMLYEDAGSFADAARCWERTGDLQKAVAALERLDENEHDAEKLYVICKKLANSYRKDKDFSAMMGVVAKFATVDDQLEFLRRHKLTDQVMQTQIKHKLFAEAAREKARNRSKDTPKAKESAFRDAASVLALSDRVEDALERSRYLIAQSMAMSAPATAKPVQDLLQEAHDILSAQTTDRLELTRAKVLLGKAKEGDVSLLGAAYESFVSTVESPLGQVVVLKAAIDAGQTAEFASYCRRAGRDLSITDDSDEDAVVRKFCSLCATLLGASSALLSDPYVGLQRHQSLAGMIFVADLNVTLQQFCPDLSLFDMPGVEDGKLAASTQCEEAMKHVLAVQCVPMIDQLVHGQVDAMDVDPMLAEVQPVEEETHWRLELKPSEKGSWWQVLLSEVTVHKAHRAADASAKTLSMFHRLHFQLLLSQQGLEISNLHPNKRLLVQKFQDQIKKLSTTACDVISTAVKQSLLQGGASPVASLQACVDLWEDRPKAVVRARVEDRLRRVDTETGLLELLQLCAVVTHDDSQRDSLFQRCLPERFRDRVDILGADGKTMPAIQLLRGACCDHFDYLVFLHVAGKKLGDTHLVMLETTCLQWLWQVAQVPKRLCFPKRVHAAFTATKALGRRQQHLRQHADACVVLLCKAEFEGDDAKPVLLMLTLLLLLAEHTRALGDRMLCQEGLDMLYDRAEQLEHASAVHGAGCIDHSSDSGKSSTLTVRFSQAFSTCNHIVAQRGDALHKAVLSKKAPSTGSPLKGYTKGKAAKWLDETTQRYSKKLITGRTVQQQPEKKDPQLVEFIARCDISKDDQRSLNRAFTTLGELHKMCPEQLKTLNLSKPGRKKVEAAMKSRNTAADPATDITEAIRRLRKEMPGIGVKRLATELKRFPELYRGGKKVGAKQVREALAAIDDQAQPAAASTTPPDSAPTEKTSAGEPTSQMSTAAQPWSPPTIPTDVAGTDDLASSVVDMSWDELTQRAEQGQPSQPQGEVTAKTGATNAGVGASAALALNPVAADFVPPTTLLSSTTTSSSQSGFVLEEWVAVWEVEILKNHFSSLAQIQYAIQTGSASREQFLSMGLSYVSVCRLERGLDATNPRFWSDPLMDFEPLDLDQAYMKQVGVDPVLSINIENRARATALSETFGVPLAVTEMFRQPLENLERFALAPERMSSGATQICLFCGVFFDLENRRSHLHVAPTAPTHYEQHRAFRAMKATFDILCICQAVANFRFHAYASTRSTVLSDAQIETARELRAELPQDNPRLLALLDEDKAILATMRGSMAELSQVSSAVINVSPPGASVVWLRQFFMKMAEGSEDKPWGQKLAMDIASTGGRPYSLPWATLDLYFSESTQQLLRVLEQARDFGPRCLRMLREAVLQTNTRGALKPPARAPLPDTDDEDEELSARTEEAGVASDVTDQAVLDVVIDDDGFDIVVANLQEQRARKRGKKSNKGSTGSTGSTGGDKDKKGKDERKDTAAAGAPKTGVFFGRRKEEFDQQKTATAAVVEAAPEAEIEAVAATESEATAVAETETTAAETANEMALAEAEAKAVAEAEAKAVAETEALAAENANEFAVAEAMAAVEAKPKATEDAAAKVAAKAAAAVEKSNSLKGGGSSGSSGSGSGSSSYGSNRKALEEKRRRLDGVEQERIALEQRKREKETELAALQASISQLNEMIGAKHEEEHELHTSIQELDQQRRTQQRSQGSADKAEAEATQASR